jgi:hypothetical protein
MSRRSSLAIIVLLLAGTLFAATPGSFRGHVVELADVKKLPDEIYVISPNGSLRRVHIADARVSYGDEVPKQYRKFEPAAVLVHGAEVRVTAEEDGHGAWRASTIEILHVPGSPRARRKPLPEDRSPRPTLSRRSST